MSMGSSLIQKGGEDRREASTFKLHAPASDGVDWEGWAFSENFGSSMDRGEGEAGRSGPASLEGLEAPMER